MASLASDISPSHEAEYAEAEDNSDICKRLTFGNIAPAAISIPRPSITSSGVAKDEVQGEALQCYLRIRPFNESEQKSNVPMTNIDLFDDGHQIEIHAPEDSMTFKNGSRNPAETSWRFNFSSVLSETAGQQDVFETTLLENVQDFVTGQNTLVFTYGATNGGKTYTMLGKPSDAGLIPRTLDTIFNSIKHRLGTPYEMKPKNFSLVRLDDASRTLELKSKNDVLSSWDKREETFTSADISSSIVDDSLIAGANTTMSYASDASSQQHLPGNVSSDELSLSFVPEVDMNRQRDCRTRVSIEPQGKVRFSVFVSYAEIYNELIYDLLDKPPMTKHVRRVALKLAEDKSKRHHIKGLKEVEVRTADEAFKLLQIGQINRQVASTRLNQRSSRSHAIFTIKVLRVVDINDPTYARVSSMSFVDLAGSERNRGQDGVRLKEACNINTSLLTLGKCIEIMRFNQRNRCSAQRLVPFRESKLTRLFMGFFQGEGRVTMIVNINQLAAMFDDTYRVLRFSALARELVPSSHRPAHRAHHGSAHVPGRVPSKDVKEEKDATDGRDGKDIDETKMAELGKLCTQHESELEEYRRIVQSLRDELRQARMEKIELEVNIRREAAEEMAQQVIEIEESNQERVAETVTALEERHEQQLEILSKSIKRRYVKKRRRPDSDGDGDEFEGALGKVRGRRDADRLQAKCKELESERLALEEELTERIHQLQRDKSVLQYELGGKVEDAAERSAELAAKCARLEAAVADLTQRLAAENGRYCNLQEDFGRMRHETNGEIQRKKEMAATIEELTRELLKARAEVVQLRHEQATARERAAFKSRRGAAGCSLDAGAGPPTPTPAARDEAQQLAAELRRAQQQLTQSDAEHARELEQVSGAAAEASQSLRDVQQTVAAHEQEMAQSDAEHARELEQVSGAAAEALQSLRDVQQTMAAHEQEMAQSDAEHAQELALASGAAAEALQSLRDVQQTMAAHEQEMAQLNDDLAQRDRQLRTFEERHREQSERIRDMEAAAADSTAAAARAAADADSTAAAARAAAADAITAAAARAAAADDDITAAAAHAAADITAAVARATAAADSTAAAAAARAAADAEQRGADASGRRAQEMERLKAELEAQQAAHASALATISAALGSATDEKDLAEFRLQETLAEHQEELDQLTSRLEAAQSDHSAALRALQARVDEAARPETTAPGNAGNAWGTEECFDDKENQPAASDASEKCNVDEQLGDTASAGGASDSSDPLETTQDFGGEVSAIGEDVVDPALVYDMETSVHEERDVTPGMGQKRKRFTRQCKKNAGGKEGAPTGAKRAKKMKEAQRSCSIADGDSTSTGRGSASSIVALLTSPFSKPSSKGSNNNNSSSSREGRASPLAPTNCADGAARRTRRKLLGKSQISSPISIAGCGPAMELSNRRLRR